MPKPAQQRKARPAFPPIDVCRYFARQHTPCHTQFRLRNCATGTAMELQTTRRAASGNAPDSYTMHFITREVAQLLYTSPFATPKWFGFTTREIGHRVWARPGGISRKPRAPGLASRPANCRAMPNSALQRLHRAPAIRHRGDLARLSNEVLARRGWTCGGNELTRFPGQAPGYRL
jgi:hypothetical protein